MTAVIIAILLLLLPTGQKVAPSSHKPLASLVASSFDNGLALAWMHSLASAIVNYPQRPTTSTTRPTLQGTREKRISPSLLLSFHIHIGDKIL